MRPWNDPKLVAKTPIATVFLLEYANVGQLVRMWSEGSALGQNIWSWVSVNAALWLWLNFYRVVTPEAVWARRATVAGIVLNGAVIFSVAWFRWFAVFVLSRSLRP